MMGDWREKAEGCRLVVSLGATMMVGDDTWAKPSVSCDVSFRGIPSDEDLMGAWDWLWDNQVIPQSDGLLRVIVAALRAKET